MLTLRLNTSLALSLSLSLSLFVVCACSGSTHFSYFFFASSLSQLTCLSFFSFFPSFPFFYLSFVLAFSLSLPRLSSDFPVSPSLCLSLPLFLLEYLPSSTFLCPPPAPSLRPWSHLLSHAVYPQSFLLCVSLVFSSSLTPFICYTLTSTFSFYIFLSVSFSSCLYFWMIHSVDEAWQGLFLKPLPTPY